MLSVGLPVTFEGVGLAGVSADEILAFANYCLDSPVSFFDSMVTHITAESLANAMLAADDYEKRRSKIKLA